MLMPDKKEALLARAEEIAQHRVVVGMHFPHDVAGGKKLAELIVAELKKSPDFTKDLAAAKAELAARP